MSYNVLTIIRYMTQPRLEYSG